jgi:drug/metabolite transporter (DMT)-like permease
MPQLALVLTTVIWAATFPATKVALQHAGPMSFLFLRFLVSTLAVAAVVLSFRQKLRHDPATLRMAGTAAVFLIIGYVLQTIGMQYTSASNSAFITALYVVFVPLFLGRFGLHLWTALGLALAGLWLLIRPSTVINTGDLLTLACAIAFALHIISLEFFANKTDVQSLASWQLIMVTIALLVPGVWDVRSAQSDLLRPSLIWALVITGVLATGLAFFIQVWAQRRVPAQRVALIFALEPALSAWMSWLTLGEKLDMMGWIGSGLILGGVLVGSIGPMPHPHDPLQP